MSTKNSIRTVGMLAATALLAGVALVAPATTAQAASTIKISGPSRVVAANTSLKFTVLASGDVDDWDGRVTKVASRVGSPSTPGGPSGTITLGAASTVSVAMSAYTTPGRYRLTIRLKKTGAVSSSAYRDFDVIANSAVTESQDYFNMYGVFSKRSRWQVQYTGPTYVRGAKLSIYYKAKGKKKYTKIGSKTLNSVGDASFKLKKGKVRKTGKLYYKLSAVSWAPAMKSHTYSIVKR